MAEVPKTSNALLHGALDGLILKVLSRGPSHGYAVARAIEEATGASESHARLLARDQTLKLYSQVTQERHQAAGVTEYVWRSSRDERVRERHKALDGTRQKYSDPPVVDEATGRRAHPGDDFQCRCTADPVLPGID